MISPRPRRSASSGTRRNAVVLASNYRVLDSIVKFSVEQGELVDRAPFPLAF
jgi:hypothetical protein